MKKILCCLLVAVTVLCCVRCETKPATYTIQYRHAYSWDNLTDPKAKFIITIDEYNNIGEKVNVQKWSPSKPRIDKEFTAHPLAKKFVVHVSYSEFLESVYRDVYMINDYIDAVFYLSIENVIKVHEDMNLTKANPLY